MKNVEKRSNDYYTLCPTNESFAKRELPLSSGMTYSYTALSCFQPPESYRYPYDQSPLSPSFLFSSSLLYAPHLHFLLLPLLSFPPISIILYPTPNSPTLYLHCTPRYDSFWTFASPLTSIRINYIYTCIVSLSFCNFLFCSLFARVIFFLDRSFVPWFYHFLYRISFTVQRSCTYYINICISIDIFFCFFIYFSITLILCTFLFFYYPFKQSSIILSLFSFSYFVLFLHSFFLHSLHLFFLLFLLMYLFFILFFHFNFLQITIICSLFFFFWHVIILYYISYYYIIIQFFKFYWKDFLQFYLFFIKISHLYIYIAFICYICIYNSKNINSYNIF